ncbi:hypothetical protein LINPERHAP1_LOCUS10171 [Linum perenne]
MRVQLSLTPMLTRLALPWEPNQSRRFLPWNLGQSRMKAPKKNNNQNKKQKGNNDLGSGTVVVEGDFALPPLVHLNRYSHGKGLNHGSDLILTNRAKPFQSKEIDSTRAHWKVAVSREERTHFVLLDDRQLRWLKDVMLLASRDNWKVPADCSTASSRRTVTVSVGWRGGVKVLIVLERCRDRRNFYILVPADRDMEGWRKFLCSRVKEGGER